MKIEICEKGHLSIERAGKMVAQGCPFDSSGVRCGHWCPFFGEPRMNGGCNGERRYEDSLTLCNSYTLYGEITDKREAKEKVGQ